MALSTLEGSKGIQLFKQQNASFSCWSCLFSPFLNPCHLAFIPPSTRGLTSRVGALGKPCRQSSLIHARDRQSPVELLLSLTLAVALKAAAAPTTTAAASRAYFGTWGGCPSQPPVVILLLPTSRANCVLSVENHPVPQKSLLLFSSAAGSILRALEICCRFYAHKSQMSYVHHSVIPQMKLRLPHTLKATWQSGV